MTPASGKESRLRSQLRLGLRRLIPHARRPRLRALYNRSTWWLFVGNAVECNCCGTSFRRFRAYVGTDGHRSLMCPRCGSLGRHRVDWLYLMTRTDALAGPVSVLHVAPEVCLELPLRALPTVQYLSADYDSTLAMEQIDVTDIRYEDETFDGVICNHVLQLVDDDRRAMRELCRVLKPGGWALLQSAVKFARDHTVDQPAFQPLDAEGDRYEEVVMRTYGRDYADRLTEAGFDVTVSELVNELSGDVVTRLGLDPDERVFFCRRPPAREDDERSTGPGAEVS
jgi:SAM-dependent methyltransferase